MEQFIKNYLADIGTIATILSLVLALGVLAFSALRYVRVRRDELRNLRYERYHSLLSIISRGSDVNGALKQISQRAYIYELRHFPEYKPLTIRLLRSLKSEWRKNGSAEIDVLESEIDETIIALER
jgi:hypothetical protein